MLAATVWLPPPVALAQSPCGPARALRRHTRSVGLHVARHSEGAAEADGASISKDSQGAGAAAPSSSAVGDDGASSKVPARRKARTPASVASRSGRQSSAGPPPSGGTTSDASMGRGAAGVAAEAEAGLDGPQRRWLSERANLQLEALLEARRMAALGAARQVAATPSANSGHSYAAPESNSMNAEPGSAATNQPPPGASVLRQRQPRKKAPAKNKAVVKSSSVPVTSEASADSAQPPQAKMAVPSSAHSQPTEEERGAQRAAALSQQRATAAAAQVAQPEYGPAFPRKDPAKQPPLVAGARMIDIRMYEQVAASRMRMASQLSASNRYVGFLERALESRRSEVAAALGSMQCLARELDSLEDLTKSASAAALHGLDKAETKRKMEALLERIDSLAKSTDVSMEALDTLVAREVPVEWYGVASQVRLMGDFDGWTRGLDLSAEDWGSDNVFTRFTAKLLLPKGVYNVKFTVDGEWRTAPGWPEVANADGTTNNILTVD